VTLNVYNLLNANTGTAFQQVFAVANNGSTWLNPTAIMAPRLARFNATLSF